MSSNNPLLRRSESGRAEENLYSRFGLTSNPFPDSPTIVPGSNDPRLNGEIYNDDLRSRENDQFERLLIPQLDGPKARPIALLMDYATKRGRGIGKTAFLNYQRRRIMGDLGGQLTQGSYVLLAAHLIPEGGGRTRKFWQFTRMIARALNDGHCIAWAMWRLRALSGQIPQTILDKVNQQDPEPTLGNNEWLADNGVEVLFSLNHVLKQTLARAGIRPDVAESLAQYGHSPKEWEASFLNYQTDYRWRHEGYELVFNDLVRLFKAAEVDYTLLLVDEVEKIVVPQNRNERRAFVDDLRHFFIDGPYQSVYTRFYNLLFTIHPYVQELWTPHWKAAGLDRTCPISGGAAQEFTIYFYPLEAEETAVPLVLSYLDFFRVSPEQRGTLHPFNEESVVEALRLSSGLPGLMLTVLRLVLERAIEENRETINADNVRTIYRSAIPVEPPEEEPQPLPSVRVDLLEDE